jgi:hypothetical protein
MMAVATCRFGHRALGRVYGSIVAFGEHGGSPPCPDAGGPLRQRTPAQMLLRAGV